MAKLSGVTSEKDNVELICEDCSEDRKVRFQMSGQRVSIGDYVKIELTDANGRAVAGVDPTVEHMWCKVQGVKGDGAKKIYLADVANDPVVLTNVRLHQRIELTYDQIEDMIKRGDIDEGKGT